MTFHDLQEALSDNFDALVGKYGRAYQTDVDKDELWNTYLESFPPKKNPIFRVRRWALSAIYQRKGAKELSQA